MSDGKIHDEASEVDSAPGEVMVDGPDGVAVSMTPEAAVKTAGRLMDHAAAAKGQQDVADDLKRRSARS